MRQFIWMLPDGDRFSDEIPSGRMSPPTNTDQWINVRHNVSGGFCKYQGWQIIPLPNFARLANSCALKTCVDSNRMGR
jgi:hypothetical protein